MIPRSVMPNSAHQSDIPIISRTSYALASTLSVNFFSHRLSSNSYPTTVCVNFASPTQSLRQSCVLHKSYQQDCPPSSIKIPVPRPLQSKIPQHPSRCPILPLPCMPTQFPHVHSRKVSSPQKSFHRQRSSIAAV